MSRCPIIWRELSHSPRRQLLVKRLVACGPRIVLEAVGHIEAGGDVDSILEALVGLSPQDYQAAGVADLPIDRLKVVNGGRR
jgi:hypothetical protein